MNMNIESMSAKEFKNKLKKEAAEKEIFIIHHFEETFKKLNEYFENNDIYVLDNKMIKEEKMNFEKCVCLLFESSSEYADKMNRVVDVGGDEFDNEFEEYFYVKWNDIVWTFLSKTRENGLHEHKIILTLDKMNEDLVNSHVDVKEYFNKKIESRKNMLKLLKSN